MRILQNENLAKDLKESQKMHITKINYSDKNSLNVLKEYLDKERYKTKINNGEKVVFDSENISEYKVFGTDLIFYFVPQTNYDEKSPENYSSGYIIENNKIKYSGILKEERLEKNIKIITYLNNDYSPMVRVTVNESTQKVTIENMISTSMITKRRRDQSESFSDCVMSCIEDAYRKDGWSSVALWCGTLYCPEIGVAVMFLCMQGCAS